MSDDYVGREGGDHPQDILTNNILLDKRIVIDNNNGEERIRPGVSLLGVSFKSTTKTTTTTNTEVPVSIQPPPLPPPVTQQVKLPALN